jgi:hypothetical protein
MMGGGGVLGPVTELMGNPSSLQQAMDGTAPPADAHKLELALQQMQNAASAPATPEAGTGLLGLVDPLIWLALMPLVHMRLRDMGVSSNMIWWWTAAVYLGMAMDAVEKGLGTPLFGWWSTVAGVVGFITLGWICLAPSKAREVTAEPRSGKNNLDDNDPYPPFRP